MVSFAFGTLRILELIFFPSAVLLAIFPWISLLFGTVLIFILFAAARKREATAQPPISDGEKADYQT